MKIVFLDTDTLGEVDSLKNFSEFGEVSFFGATRPEETIARLDNIDVVFTNKVVIDQKVMDACPQLKFIGVLATGTNNIDLEYAKQKGITVNNVAGYSTESVAQHTFSMLLSLLHNSAFYSQYSKTEYSDSPIFTNISRPYWELKGKTIGIIGLGNIGKRVALLAGAFGMEVVYYSTSGKNNNSDYKQVSLEELLKVSDVVSIHAPLNENTQKLIGDAEFRKMKKSAYLLNNGRGGIVDEHALSIALSEKSIAGAGLDVFEKEPLNSDSPLRNCGDELILSPHIAWASIEARNELIRLSIDNLKTYLS